MYKLDANHLEIKNALLEAGRPVFDSGHMGSGLSDLITTHVDGHVIFVEVKRNGPPSARKLTPAEEKFRKKFPQAHVVVQTKSEALRAVGLAA